MNRCLLPMTVLAMFVFAVAARSETPGGEGEWTRFRGPNGSGLSRATTVPVRWTEQDYNWKVETPGIGHSSPVVWGDRIFLTGGDRETAGRTVLCLDTADGRVIWRRDFASSPYRQHGANSYASATPAVDALGLVVTWTTPDEVVLLALDHGGRELWRRGLGPFVGGRGSGASPIIVGDLVVLANDQENPNLLPENRGRPDPITPIGESFLIAVDRKTGVTRWQTERRTGLATYSTPCVFQPNDGPDAGPDAEPAQLIFTSTAHGITSVDPATGRINWELDELLPERCVASPVAARGLVFGGYGRGIRGTRYVAVRPGSPEKEQGPAGGGPTVAYDFTKSVPLVPTPVAVGGWLFLWSDDGIVTCADIESGDILWRERVGGSFYSSPVWIDHRLYCVDRSGQVVVLAAAERFEVLARMPLGEPMSATPAVAGGVLYLRTHTHLISLGGE